jgi:hypothetical protein
MLLLLLLLASLPAHKRCFAHTPAVLLLLIYVCFELLLLWLQASLPSYMNKKGRFHKGSCVGLRAWGLARLVQVKEAGSSSRSKDKDKVRIAADGLCILHSGICC